MSDESHGLTGRRLALVGAGVALTVVLVAVFYATARHFVPVNSDNATLVLEGQTLAHGGIALHGWALALDSFWTSEAPVYAFAIALGGLRDPLLFLVPAVFAALVVVVGMWLARGDARGARAAVGPLGVLVVLGLPAPALSYFFLQGAWHVGTTLACLVAFGALASRWRFGPLLGTVALVVALLGDLQTLLLGVAPVVVGGVAAGLRARRLRRVVPFVGVGIVAPLIAYAVRRIAGAFGAFSIVNPNPTASWHELFANLARLPAREAGMLGAVAMPIQVATGGSTIARVLHGAVLLAVIAALVVAVAGLVRGVVVGPRSAGEGLASRLIATDTLDDLLLAGVVFDLADFAVLSGTGNGNYARYLTASVVFAVVLTGRAASRLVEDLPAERWRPLVFALCSGALLFGAAFVTEFSLARSTDGPEALGAFLVAHHLDSGVGDYWSSSIVSVETDGRALVRPVIEAPSGRLVRYGRQSAAQWYAGEKFSFLVFDTRLPWRGVDTATALATFGVPSRTFVVGTYRVLVYPRPFMISTLGYTRGTPSVASGPAPAPR